MGDEASELVKQMKRNGQFDALRRELLEEFRSSSNHAKATELQARLAAIVGEEVERDPSLLRRDRGKAAPLIAGAVDRTDLWKWAQGNMDMEKFDTVSFREEIKQILREIKEGKEGGG